MVCLEKRIPEGIPELEELLPVYLSDEASCFFLCIVQDSRISRLWERNRRRKT